MVGGVNIDSIFKGHNRPALDQWDTPSGANRVYSGIAIEWATASEEIKRSFEPWLSRPVPENNNEEGN